jgi:5S rRNA maturation endonuclease (ribonuclease M5)
LLEITRAADGTYRGRLTSINEGNAVALLTDVNVDGDKVRYRLPASIPGSYEGKLSADGATITGTWTQAGVAPLVFYKLVR